MNQILLVVLLSVFGIVSKANCVIEIADVPKKISIIALDNVITGFQSDNLVSSRYRFGLSRFMSSFFRNHHHVGRGGGFSGGFYRGMQYILIIVLVPLFVLYLHNIITRPRYKRK